MMAATVEPVWGNLMSKSVRLSHHAPAAAVDPLAGAASAARSHGAMAELLRGLHRYYGCSDKSPDAVATKRGRKYRLAHSLLAVALLTCGVFSSDDAAADKHRRGGELSAAEAAAQVQRRTGGQALGVQEERVDGRKVYRVRVLTREGRVREITVEAGSRDR